MAICQNQSRDKIFWFYFLLVGKFAGQIANAVEGVASYTFL